MVERALSIAMKAIPRKHLVAGAIALGLVAVAVLAGIGSTRWSSPAHRSRAHVATLKSWHVDFSNWFRDGAFEPMENQIGSYPHPTWSQVRQRSLRSHYRQRYWKKVSRVADAPISTPHPRMTARITVLGTKREEAARQNGLEIPLETLQADAANAVHWPGAPLQLRAIATAWCTDVDEPVTVRADYHDANDGRRLVLEELPKALQEITPEDARYLHLTLLFEAEGDLPFEDMEVLVFDARTHASVAACFRLDHIESGYVTRTDGGFLALDLEAAIWHDTPLDVMVDLPAGPEQRQPFPAVGQTVTFLGAQQRRIELTRLATGEGYPNILDVFGANPKVTFTWQRLEPSVFPQTGSGETVPPERQPSLWDLGDLVESDYLRVRAQREDGEWVNYPMGQFDHGLDAEGAELIFRPGRQRCWFKVAGLPAAPNPRSVRDFLDVRIPGPVEQVEYGWIAEAAQLDYDSQYSNPSASLLDLPLPNVTLRELLRLHAKLEDDIVTVDRENLRLSAESRRRDWRDDLGDWWRAAFREIGFP